MLWTSRAMESLWLLAALLVPLAFFSRDYVLSEAVIAFVEVPKIALLRILVAGVGMLWLVEWGLQGRLPLVSGFTGIITTVKLRGWLPKFVEWIRERPSRWVHLAVWLYLLTTFLSTALSASFWVSLWGEVPGQDGFQAYNIAAYLLLFGAIATHLKTRSQLWRLMGVIVVMGTLAGGYGVAQSYGRDFLGLMEPAEASRVTMATGNAVFAGSMMLMPICVTLICAAITLKEPIVFARRLRTNAGLWLLTLAAGSLWTLVLSVQLLGLVFTLSRGPWVGTLAALLGILGLALVTVGWRAAGRAGLVLGLAGGLTLAVVRWPGILSALGGAEVLIPLVLVAALVALAVLCYSWRSGGWVSLGFGKILPAAGSALIVVGILGILVILFRPEFRSVLNVPGSEGRDVAHVVERFASIRGEVVTGEISDRGVIWQGSWRLIQDHPWFSFDGLSLPWLRPLVGYGPDLFRYTYLLESRPKGESLLPLEPDHAHNYLLHQWVEQGILGVVSAFGLYLSVLLAGGYQMWRYRKQLSEQHILILSGLLAAFAGRFLEQVVGVARVSDLTIFWILLAVFAALPMVLASSRVAEASAPPLPRSVRTRRRTRLHRRQDYDWPMVVRMAVVAWICGGVFALTWVMTINNVRASTVAADSVEQFSRADFGASLQSLNRAVELAPDVPTYYYFRSLIYDAFYKYRANDGVSRNLECGFRFDGVSYESCLVQKSYQSNLTGLQKRPFYLRARLAVADSAFFLSSDDEAIKLYLETISMVPASWPLYDRLAGVYFDTGRFDEARQALEKSIAITGDTHNSEGARNLQLSIRNEIAKSSNSPTIP